MSPRTSLAVIAVGVSLIAVVACDVGNTYGPYPEPPAGSFTAAQFDVENGTTTTSVNGASVNAQFFPATKLQPILGRLFIDGDHGGNGTPVVILSYALWQRVFGSSPKVLGTPVKIDGKARIIVGVMPKGFAYPKGADLWIPE